MFFGITTYSVLEEWNLKSSFLPPFCLFDQHLPPSQDYFRLTLRWSSGHRNDSGKSCRELNRILLLVSLDILPYLFLFFFFRCGKWNPLLTDSSNGQKVLGSFCIHSPFNAFSNENFFFFFSQNIIFIRSWIRNAK